MAREWTPSPHSPAQVCDPDEAGTVRLMSPTRHLIGRLYAPAIAQLIKTHEQPSILTWKDRVFRWSSTHRYYVEAVDVWNITHFDVTAVHPSKEECPACA